MVTSFPPQAEHIYGRDEELAALCQLASAPIKATQGLLLLGEGGTGKTFLLEKMIERLQQSANEADQQPVCILPLYDFYHIDNFKASSIENAIIAALEPTTLDPDQMKPGAYFQLYIEQYSRLQQSRQSGAQFQIEQKKLRQAFVACYNRFATAEAAAGRPVVLLFDTTEQAIDLSDRAAEVLLKGHQEANWGGEYWLCEIVPQLINTLAIFSGRPQTLYGAQVPFYTRLEKAITKHSGRWQSLSIAGIGFEDSMAFAEDVKSRLSRRELPDSIKGMAKEVQLSAEPKQRLWFQIADGLPFWISMLFTREMLGVEPNPESLLELYQGQMYDDLTLELSPDERKQLRDALMRKVLLNELPQNASIHNIALQWMAEARKGLSVGILHRLLEKAGRSDDAAKLFAELESLLIVKRRTLPRYTDDDPESSETLLFLHDEIYRWLDSATESTKTSQDIIIWYTEAIDAAEQARLAAVDTMLAFPSDDIAPPIAPLKDEPLRLPEPSATSNPAYQQARQHRDAAMRRKQQLILDRLGYYFQESQERGIREYNILAYAAIINRDYGFNVTVRQEGLRNLYRTGGITREVEIECAARWLLRAVYADDKWIKTLQQRIQRAYNDKHDQPGLHIALLQLAKAQAQLLTNPSEGHAKTLTLLASAWKIAGGELQAERTNDWQGFLLGQIRNFQGFAYRHIYDLSASIQYYRAALAIHKDYDRLPIEFQASTLNNVAYAYSEQGDVDDARSFAFQALELRQRFGTDFNIGLSFNTLARIDLRNGNGRRALSYAARALGIFARLDATRGLALCLPVLANAWRKTAEEAHDTGTQYQGLQHALEWFAYTEALFTKRGINAAERRRELYQQWGCTYRSLALMLARRNPQATEATKLFEQAQEKMEQALDVAQKAALPGIMLLEIYEDLAVIQITQQHYDQQAQTYLDAAEQCAPPEYHIRESGGIAELANPTRAYWRGLGQCQLQRMLLYFGQYTLGVRQSHIGDANHSALLDFISVYGTLLLQVTLIWRSRNAWLTLRQSGS